MIPAIKSRLQHVLGRSVADVPPLPRPDIPICVIGDLHGRDDLLQDMLARIAVEPQGAAARLIFVGDLVDRGTDSASVLRRLHAMCQTEPDRIICLMGNHERMMLDFLAAPTGRARRWLTVGGIETLHSFGISARLAPEPRRDTSMVALAQALQTALSPNLLPWLQVLPSHWQGEGLAVVHADAWPHQALSNQPASALLWGRHVRHHSPRRDGLWLAHGHVIVPEVQITPGRIALDTGAYATGRLSALWLGPDGHRVIVVGPRA